MITWVYFDAIYIIYTIPYMDYIQLDGYIILVPWVEDSRLNINRYTQRKTNLINHKTAVNRQLTTHIVMWSVTWSGHVMSRARKTHLTRSPSDLFDHKTGFFELLSSTQAYNHNLILSFNVFFFEILEFLGKHFLPSFGKKLGILSFIFELRDFGGGITSAWCMLRIAT